MVPNLKFTDVDPNGLDEKKYCMTWTLNFSYHIFLIIMSALLVVVYNSFTSRIFQRLGML